MSVDVQQHQPPLKGVSMDGNHHDAETTTTTTTTTKTKLVDDSSLRNLICPFSVSDLYPNSSLSPSSSLSLSTSPALAWDRMVKCITTHHQVVLLPPYTMTMTLYIATASVGAVIGRRGQTVAALQKSAAQVASTHQPVRVSVVAATKEEGLANHGGGNTNVAGTATSTAAAASSTTTGGTGSNGTTINNTTTTHTASPATGNLNHARTPSPPASNSTASDYHTYTPLDWSDPNWTPVVIRADAPAVCHAAHGLVELLSKTPGTNNTSGGGGGGSHNNNNHNNNNHMNTTQMLQNAHLIMDQVILDVPVPRQKHSTLVGKWGQTLATFSADADVRIMIPQQPTSTTTTTIGKGHYAQQQQRLDLIQLEGDLWNVLVCLANIMSLLVQSPSLLAKSHHHHESGSTTVTATSANAAPHASSNYNSNNNATSSSSNVHHLVNGAATTNTATTTTTNITTTTTTMSTATVSLLALPSQTKLRNIARKTDCQIRKQRKSNTLTVTGSSTEQVSLAIQLLQKWQASQQQQQQQGGTGTTSEDAPMTTTEGGTIVAGEESTMTTTTASSPPSSTRNRGRGGGRGRGNSSNKRNQGGGGGGHGGGGGSGGHGGGGSGNANDKNNNN